MEAHHLEITKTARYWTYGNPSAQTKNVWFVCHGYGQLAEFFIKKFQVLNPDENYVIAPEALSRFYLKGFSDKVGATWMTREDRLNEIKDYVNYLNQVYQHIFAQAAFSREKVKVYALGFSQGTNTVCRWIFNKQLKINRLIIWAGNFPPDVDYSLASQILGENPLTFVYGTEDELISKQIFENEINQLTIKKIAFETITFEGKHELNEKVILQLVDN